MGWLYFGIWCFVGMIILALEVRQNAAHGEDFDIDEEDPITILFAIVFSIIFWPLTLAFLLMNWGKNSGQRKFEQKQLDKEEDQG